jgi:hypothetical protein
MDENRERACLHHLQEALACLNAEGADAIIAARIEHAIDDLRRRLIEREADRNA